MRVLGLSSYPVESAATRFRMVQYVEPLREHGIDLSVEPFLSSRQFKEHYGGEGIAAKAAGLIKPVMKRIAGLADAGKYDLLFVQREAMFFGPAVFEMLYRTLGRLPMILDLDDATYVSYVSPSYGKLGSFFKFFGKTDKLIKQSAIVVCGNRFIAEYAASKGVRTVVVPTVADTDIFSPLEKDHKVPVVGWIGTHSTLPFLESIFPVLERLAKTYEFKLRIIGAGKADTKIADVDVENREWNLEREPEDFRTLDIGLYPIAVSSSANEEWLKGKSGFKAIQYLAVGVPFVMSPVGICAEIGNPGITHLNATSPEDWYNFLSKLLANAALRKEMGAAGRSFALANYTVPQQSAVLANAFRAVAGSRK